MYEQIKQIMFVMTGASKCIASFKRYQLKTIQLNLLN